MINSKPYLLILKIHNPKLIPTQYLMDKVLDKLIISMKLSIVININLPKKSCYSHFHTSNIEKYVPKVKIFKTEFFY
jgi:hypothetical protein